MSKRIKVSKQLDKRFKEIESGAKEINETGSVDFKDLFTQNFMTRYTNFTNITEFFEESPFEFETQKEFESIDEKRLDEYVQQQSKFESWKDMFSTAGKEYVVKKLGF